MMAGTFPREHQAQPGAEHMIREFSLARRLTIPEDDANGTLLNEAVVVHLDSADGSGPIPGDFQYVGIGHRSVAVHKTD